MTGVDTPRQGRTSALPSSARANTGRAQMLPRRDLSTLSAFNRIAALAVLAGSIAILFIYARRCYYARAMACRGLRLVI
jgi:hypothetical protein